MRITANNLKFVRAAVGMEQDDLARLSGVSRGLVSQIERGTRKLHSDVERNFRRSVGLSDETIARLNDLYRDVQNERYKD
jgi:transcriptional regulator with XRE-family HTH domain